MRGCKHEQECRYKQSMCDCITRMKDDLAVQINHLMGYFVYTGYELSYTTLEPEEGRCLCKIGQCRICKRCLCIGRELPAQATRDELLVEIYLWMCQMLGNPNGQRSFNSGSFEDLFLSLFHESDRDFVSEWLNHRSTKMILNYRG